MKLDNEKLGYFLFGAWIATGIITSFIPSQYAKSYAKVIEEKINEINNDNIGKNFFLNWSALISYDDNNLERKHLYMNIESIKNNCVTLSSVTNPKIKVMGIIKNDKIMPVSVGDEDIYNIDLKMYKPINDIKPINIDYINEIDYQPIVSYDLIKEYEKELNKNLILTRTK